MDLCQVRYFLAVCSEGSFTAAAKACGVSQPSVTTGVRRLERTVGGKLFERRHPVRLTAFGAELRPLLESMQMAADHVTAAIAERAGRTRPAAIRAGSAGLLGRFPTPHARSPKHTAADPGARSLPPGAADTLTITDPSASPILQPAPAVEHASHAARAQSIIIRSRIAIQRANRAIMNANIALGRGQELQN